MGSSKPWPDALQVSTGERQLNANAFLEYFSPLMKWLKHENKRLGIKVGWEESDSKITIL
jgi:peptidyl-dipeptidase A